jgi:hypothetical protein
MVYESSNKRGQCQPPGDSRRCIRSKARFRGTQLQSRRSRGIQKADAGEIDLDLVTCHPFTGPLLPHSSHPLCAPVSVLSVTFFTHPVVQDGSTVVSAAVKHVASGQIRSYLGSNEFGGP